MDLLSFEYGDAIPSDAIPSPYFNLEDELAETKKKLQRLEAKYKKNKEQTKQRWKQMENRLDEMDKMVKKYLQLDSNAIPIIPCISDRKLQGLCDFYCSEIKVSNSNSNYLNSNGLFLSIDGNVLCDLELLIADNKSHARFLRQFTLIESLKIELPNRIRNGHIQLLVKVCDALLYNYHLSEKGNLDVLFKQHHTGDTRVIQEMIKLFKKTCTICTNWGEKTRPYSKFTLELECPSAYQREIDEMKAHCTANEIAFTFNEICI